MLELGGSIYDYVSCSRLSPRRSSRAKNSLPYEPTGLSIAGVPRRAMHPVRAVGVHAGSTHRKTAGIVRSMKSAMAAYVGPL